MALSPSAVLLATGILMATPLPASSQPALDRGTSAGGLTLFPDAEAPGRYYYAPGPMTLVEDGGRSSVRFLLTRRVGTAVQGTQGEVDYFAHLSFVVETRPVTADQLEAARADLRDGGVSSPDLQLLPLSRTETRVIFEPLGGEARDTLPEGLFEAEPPPMSAGPGRRTYTLRLDRYSAEAVWKSLERGQALITFSWAYVAEGTVGGGGLLTAEGDLAVGDAPFRFPDSAAGPESDGPGPGRFVVGADAFPILLDPEADQDLIRIVDLNEDRSPPGYAVLDVRCYDFRARSHPELAMKWVELEGEAVNGRTASKLLIFRSDRPDEAVHRVRFPYAVRLDRPLRYRVTEVFDDGRRIEHDWEERPWVGVLDVTRAPANDRSRS